MKKKNSSDLLVLFFIITWACLAVMGFLFVKTRLQNQRLKNSVAVLGKSLDYLDENLKKSQESNEEEQYQKKALDYIQWQFALRDQVNQANQRLKEGINKTKDLKRDKALLNLLYYNLGLSFTLSVDFGQAITAFEEALKFDPRDADSCYSLGLLYSVYSRDNKKALRYYKKYLEFAPGGTKRDEVKQRINTLEKK